MQAISPVIAPEFASAEVTYAKEQEQYRPLPVHKTSDGVILSRWHLSDEERRAVINGADIWLYVWTFNQPLQPIRMEVAEAERSAVDVAQYMQLLEPSNEGGLEEKHVHNHYKDQNWHVMFCECGAVFGDEESYNGFVQSGHGQKMRMVLNLYHAGPLPEEAA